MEKDKEILVELKDIDFNYDKRVIFSKLNLTVQKNEFIVILGPSGCGKTTILNLLNGYIKPNAGNISIDGAIKSVSQQGSLLPWLNLANNIKIAVRDIPNKDLMNKEVEDILTMINLTGFNEHYPHELSGGMKQRAELGRAIIGHSDILLMDEPFSSLDYLTRISVRKDLIKLLKQRPKTVVMVTHDIEEAVLLADRIVILSKNPSTVEKILTINHSHPRDSTTPELAITIREIMIILGIN